MIFIGLVNMHGQEIQPGCLPIFGYSKVNYLGIQGGHATLSFLASGHDAYRYVSRGCLRSTSGGNT